MYRVRRCRVLIAKINLRFLSRKIAYTSCWVLLTKCSAFHQANSAGGVMLLMKIVMQKNFVLQNGVR